LILLDELMNYISRNRASGLGGQFYHFLQNLSEVSRSRDDVVLAVSIPASELEMTPEDQADFSRFKKLLDRLGKAVVMSAETETSEIIRRRLFEWGGLSRDAHKSVEAYARWIRGHREQLPRWFPADTAQDALVATYPFHPSALSVFERKWRGLPRFQQTRGVLRLLALWVSAAYVRGFRGAHGDPLITLGTAPLDDSLFRTAVFEQLGESRLEVAVTSDVTGREHAHALRLDEGATTEVKKARLHRKIATSIFFESNGGQQRGEATLPEVRLAVAEPGLEIGNIEHCLEALSDHCYYLTTERNRYRFSFLPNLNKILADRRASVSDEAIDARMRDEVRGVFAAGSGVERIFFPTQSGGIPDRPALTLIVFAPEHPVDDDMTQQAVQRMTRASGTSARTFKSALLWSVADSPTPIRQAARRLLALDDIQADCEAGQQRLDESQQQQLRQNLGRAESDLREATWRAYRNLLLLDRDNSLRRLDLGHIHSSSAGSLLELILRRLSQEDIVVDGVSPNFLVRNWPPALSEWSTRKVRDDFFASPRFPRLLQADVLRATISRGVDDGHFAYVGKTSDEDYAPFYFRDSLRPENVEFTNELFLIKKEDAEAWKALRDEERSPVEEDSDAGGGEDSTEVVSGGSTAGLTGERTGGSPYLIQPPSPDVFEAEPVGRESGEGSIVGLQWTGEITPQKWVNFYMKVISRLIRGGGVKLTVAVDVQPEGGLSQQSCDDTRLALRELGLVGDVTILREPETE